MTSHRFAEAYDVSFARLCSGTNRFILNKLAALVGPRSSLLDVGAGTGRLATEAGLDGFQVTAVEPNSSMVRLARGRVPRAPVKWTTDSAPGLNQPAGGFDGVVANFVVNHVERPQDFIDDLHRVARPRGCVITTIWGSDSSPLQDLWTSVVDASGATPGQKNHLPAHQDFQRSAEGLAGLHRSAGATILEVTEIAWDFVIDPLDLWQAVAAGIAGIGGLFHSNPREQQEAMAQAYWRITREQTREGLLHLPSRAPCVTAQNP